MKSLILALSILAVTIPALGRSYEISTQTLVCYKTESYSDSTSCVSKASIKKDEAELELIQLQIAEIKAKQEEKTKKKKN